MSMVRMDDPGSAPVTPVAAPDGRRPGWRERTGSIAALIGLIGVAAVVSAVFWPGHANDDTFGMYREAVSGHFTDWHSAIWTAIWRAMLLAGIRSPGWMLAADVLMMLGGLYLLLRVRMRRLWALLLATLVLVFPPVLAFAVVVGTDTWFAASILCSFGFVCRSVRTRQADRIASAVVAAVLAVLAVAARPTAVPPAFALFSALALVAFGTRLGGWRRALGVVAVGAVAAALAFGTVLAIQRSVLRTQQTHPEQATYVYDLVALSVREHQVLLPVEMYPRHDLGYISTYGVTAGSGHVDISPLLWGPNAVIPPIVEGKRLDVLQHAWLAAIRQHPDSYLLTRLHSALWQLGIRGPELATWYGQTPSYYGFDRVLLPAVQTRANDYVAIGTARDATGGPLQAAWIYVLVLVLAAACYLPSRRPDSAVLGFLGLALLMYTTEIIFLSPAITYRYVWPAVAAATVLFPILVTDVVRGLRGWRRPAIATPAAASLLDAERATAPAAQPRG